MKCRLGQVATSVAILACVIGAPSPGRAEWGDDARLLGPLLGCDTGIDLEPVYYGEVFTNARGGITTRNATQYQALLDLPLTLDFERMKLPLPGRFFLLGQNTHGRGLTEDFIGDTQVISNIDSGRNIMQVSEYWWDVGLFDDDLVVRLGKQDVNTEFLVMDLAQDFIQSSFGLSPSAGLPSYPHASMAALLLVRLAPDMRLKVGVWDGLGSGANWGFSGNDVTITLAELEFKYTLFDGRLPGAVDVGAAYASGGVYAGVGLPSLDGYYVQFEQIVYRENPCREDDEQGLGVFASYFPRFADHPIPLPVIHSDVVGGVVYRGLFPRRDKDVVGAGVAWARLNEGGTDEETAIEVFYKARLTPAMSIQPDLQYIISPSGFYRDALAVGLRFEVAL